jgi:hypothetical protein
MISIVKEHRARPWNPNGSPARVMLGREWTTDQARKDSKRQNKDKDKEPDNQNKSNVERATQVRFFHQVRTFKKVPGCISGD